MSADLTESDVFVLLSERRRRLILQILQNHPPPLPMEELIELVGSCEYGDSSADNPRAIRISLHHNHLPKLDRGDVIEYDRDGGAVRPGANFDLLVDTIEAVPDRNDSCG